MSPVARTEDGVDVSWYSLGAPARPTSAGERPALLLAHATGFHGRAFTPLADRLADRFRCVAFDERGHGDSTQREDGSFDWHGFARDVRAVVDAAGLDRPFAVGHSAGGAALLLAEIARPGTFRAIYCFEPIVAPIDSVDALDAPSADDAAPRVSPPNPMAAAARRRRAVFASKQEAFDNYASKPPMAGFHADALRAYVEHGFEHVDDGVQLKCRPESEAATYEMAYRHGAFARFDDVRCPVTIAWGSTSTTLSPDAFTRQASRLPMGRTEPLDGLSHFGPFEDPERVAQSILDAFDATIRA